MTDERVSEWGSGCAGKEREMNKCSEAELTMAVLLLLLVHVAVGATERSDEEGANSGGGASAGQP